MAEAISYKSPDGTSDTYVSANTPLPVQTIAGLPPLSTTIGDGATPGTKVSVVPFSVAGGQSFPNTNSLLVGTFLVNPLTGLLDPIAGDRINGEYTNVRRLPDEQSEVFRAILDELRTITFYLKEGLNVPEEPDTVRADVAASTPTASVQ